ncbi:hypothetical protein EDB84DRAFT_1442592 [Lactarius hengduanensis]|nr:hypothetical protein EDB84DRAFT_1442592 [Lactarius hengduanensis]
MGCDFCNPAVTHLLSFPIDDSGAPPRRTHACCASGCCQATRELLAPCHVRPAHRHRDWLQAAQLREQDAGYYTDFALGLPRHYKPVKVSSDWSFSFALASALPLASAWRTGVDFWFSHQYPPSLAKSFSVRGPSSVQCPSVQAWNDKPTETPYRAKTVASTEVFINPCSASPAHFPTHTLIRLHERTRIPLPVAEKNAYHDRKKLRAGRQYNTTRVGSVSKNGHHKVTNVYDHLLNGREYAILQVRAK